MFSHYDTDVRAGEGPMKAVVLREAGQPTTVEEIALRAVGGNTGSS